MMQKNDHKLIPCWKCGNPDAASVPPLAVQVEFVMGVHRSYGSPYDWPAEEWGALLAVLEPGDVLELCKNSYLRMLMPDAQGVLISRNGETIRVDRRQLRRAGTAQAGPKKPPAVATRNAKPHPGSKPKAGRCSRYSFSGCAPTLIPSKANPRKEAIMAKQNGNGKVDHEPGLVEQALARSKARTAKVPGGHL